MISENSFGKRYHLLRREDFAAVYAGRIRSQDGLLIVLTAKNRLEISRLGLSVSKKVGNSVVRNRWKRLIREAFRQNREEIPAGFDYIVIPRREIPVPEYAAVVRSLIRRTQEVVKKQRRLESTIQQKKSLENNIKEDGE